jgi:hypothetical protein
MSNALTAQQLGEIRVRDSAVLVYRDRFGGEWVGQKEGRLHGQHAIMDRRRLLAYIDVLAKAESDRACSIPADGFVTTAEAAEHSLDDCNAFAGPKLCECGWVIEAPPAGGRPVPPQYLCIRPGEKGVEWTLDDKAALRFAREDDCKTFMSLSVLAPLLVRPAFKEWVTPC